MSKFYVGVYGCQQCYGGPEEGGWYYDWLTHERSIPVPSKEKAREVAQALAEAAHAPVSHAADIPEGESTWLDSVDGYIPTGFAVESRHVFLLERTPREHESTERPRYE